MHNIDLKDTHPQKLCFPRVAEASWINSGISKSCGRIILFDSASKKRERSWKLLYSFSSYTLSVVVKGRINILLLIEKAQISVLSQVLPLIWNKIGVRGPWVREFELMALLQFWIFCTSHTNETFQLSGVWLYLSYLRNTSLHSCRCCMGWLVRAPGVGSGQHQGPVFLWLSSSASVPWKWLLADVLRVIFDALLSAFIVGWLICMQEATQMTNSFKKASVWGSGWSTNPESEPQGWLNRNCKTSWSLKWINGSDVMGIHCARASTWGPPCSLVSCPCGLETLLHGTEETANAEEMTAPLLRYLGQDEGNWGSRACLQENLTGFWLSSISPQVLLLFFSFKFQWFYVWLSQSSTCLLVTFLMSPAC